MSLLGLIFAALTGGLRFGTQAWQSTSERLAQTDDLQLVYRTVRRQISTAINAPGNLIEARKKGSFDGRRDELSFVGSAPAGSMNPGLYLLKLFLVPDDLGQALALRWERLQDQSGAAQANNIEPLVRGVRSIQFKYFGILEEGEQPRWLDEWRDETKPPRLVQIVVNFVDSGRLPWPPLVVPVVTDG
jgi:hypothetical protein